MTYPNEPYPAMPTSPSSTPSTLCPFPMPYSTFADGAEPRTAPDHGDLTTNGYPPMPQPGVGNGDFAPEFPDDSYSERRCGISSPTWETYPRALTSPGFPTAEEYQKAPPPQGLLPSAKTYHGPLLPPSPHTPPLHLQIPSWDSGHTGQHPSPSPGGTFSAPPSSPHSYLSEPAYVGHAQLSRPELKVSPQSDPAGGSQGTCSRAPREPRTVVHVAPQPTRPTAYPPPAQNGGGTPDTTSGCKCIIM